MNERLVLCRRSCWTQKPADCKVRQLSHEQRYTCTNIHAYEHQHSYHTTTTNTAPASRLNRTWTRIWEGLDSPIPRRSILLMDGAWVSIYKERDEQDISRSWGWEALQEVEAQDREKSKSEGHAFTYTPLQVSPTHQLTQHFMTSEIGHWTPNILWQFNYCFSLINWWAVWRPH